MRAFRPREINLLYGISAERIADWAGVHLTTARRWKRGEEPPLGTLRFIELKNGGSLGLIDPQWDGWRLENGKLFSPDQQSFTPGNVLAGTFWHRLAIAYQDEQRLPRQGDWIDERWVTKVVEG